MFLRFAAHFVLFSGFTGESFDEQSSHMIIKSYIRHLALHGHLTLVPVYASRLPVDGAVEIYAQILASIDDRAQRAQVMKSIVEYSGMEVVTAAAVTTTHRLATELARQSTDRRSSASTTTIATTRVDRSRMRALEFLFVFNNHRAEGIRRANILARQFAKEGKFAAIKELFLEHVPEDSLGVIQLHRESNLEEGDENQTEDEDVERVVREYLCWKAYIQACNRYDLWRSCSTSTSVARASSYAEEKDVVAELMYHVSRSTAAMVDALHFEKGWLLGCGDADEDDSSIRRICLPQLVFNLHFLQLESAKIVLRLKSYPTYAKIELARPLLEKSLQVADVVADEMFAVADALTPEQCKELVRGFQESSIALLYLEGAALESAPVDEGANSDAE
ncbi:hypothetical protein PINS_up001645 [Pythium insidiosum]|nr:hypothetical protein PINS_up001645 [Pythium insidiosum]